MKTLTCGLLLATFSMLSHHVTAEQIVEVSSAPQRRVKTQFVEAPIRDGGLWPNMVLLANGEAYLTVFNQPAHGHVAADLDGWKSSNGGMTWTHAGAAAPRPNDRSNRMNHAMGVLDGGKRLLLVASGYQDSGSKVWSLIKPIIRESLDNGATWSDIGTFECGLTPEESVIPFGPIVRANDGSLRMTCYFAPKNPTGTRTPSSSYMLKSTDDGKTWSVLACIGARVNETAINEVAPGEWIAAARTLASEPNEKTKGQRLRQFRSFDNGETWVDEGELTGDNTHPANLIQLADGRILMSYSDRIACRIIGRLSADKGKSWGEPLIIYASWVGDGGYPSTIQFKDGSLLTAFYAKRSPIFDIEKVQYHTGIVRWDLP